MAETAADASRQVIAIPHDAHSWIEPWYGAYAILGALASGLAVIAIPLVVTDAGAPPSTIGAVIAAQNVGVMLAPFWGALADRTHAYRTVFFTGFALIGLGFLDFSFLSGFAFWLAGAFLLGLGTGASNTVAALFVVEFNPKSEWSSRISWLQTFNAVGSVFGMAFAGLLAAHWTTLVAAFLVIPAIILGGRGLPVPGGPLHIPHLRAQLIEGELSQMLHRSGPNAASVVGQVRLPPLAELKAFIHPLHSAFGLFLLAWLLFSLAVSSFGSLYPVLMRTGFGIEPARSAMIMSIATALSIPLYNFAGRLAARKGPVSTLRLGTLTRAVALAGLGVIAYLHVGWAVLPVIVLFGSYQGIWPLLSVSSNDLAADLAHFGEGTAMGLFNATAAIASALGAIAGGQVAQHFGYAAVCLFAAAGIVLSLACTAALGRPASEKAA
jgi:MFS family permease